MSEKNIKKIFIWFKKIALSFAGWIFILPLSYIIPKQSKLIIFTGSHEGRFIDNIKYLFLYLYNLKDGDCEIYFLTENKHCFNELKDKGFPVLLYPSLYTVIKLLRTSVLIVDSWWWYSNLKYYFLYKAYKIQLWHGVGFKRIELDLLKKESVLTKFISAFVGRYPVYDLIISTSEFYTEHLFSKAFKSKEILESGYPRNDSFFMDVNKDTLTGTDEENYFKIKEFKEEGYKIILYVPTHRDTGGNPVSDNMLDIKRLSSFAVENKIIFIFKFHLATEEAYEFPANIIKYDNLKDIYPVIPLADLMITDYSSIYMDYLLLDRPVIFFPYDYNKYVSKDRELQFDYEWITPGIKCFTQNELEHEITDYFLKGKDDYREKRKEILNMAFKYKDGKASERIRDFIKRKLFY